MDSQLAGTIAEDLVRQSAALGDSSLKAQNVRVTITSCTDQVGCSHGWCTGFDALTAAVDGLHHGRDVCMNPTCNLDDAASNPSLYHAVAPAAAETAAFLHQTRCCSQLT
jgi:hypothetical protein